MRPPCLDLLQILHWNVQALFITLLDCALSLGISLAQQQCLVVCPISHLVMLEVFQGLHLCVQLSDLLLLIAATTRFEHPSIDNLNLLEWTKLLQYVLEQFSSEENQL